MAEDESTTGAEGAAIRATLTLCGTLGQVAQAMASAPAELSATLRLDGPLEQIAPQIERLGLEGALAVELGGGALPLGAWEALPVALRLVERQIVELDLLGMQRRRIAETLSITAGTITVYRRMIRARFRLIPERERPPWLRSWLRRFPGRNGETDASTAV